MRAERGMNKLETSFLRGGLEWRVGVVVVVVVHWKDYLLTEGWPKLFKNWAMKKAPPLPHSPLSRASGLRIIQLAPANWPTARNQ